MTYLDNTVVFNTTLSTFAFSSDSIFLWMRHDMYRLTALFPILAALTILQGCSKIDEEIIRSELAIKAIAQGMQWAVIAKISNQSAAPLAVKAVRIVSPISLRLIEDSATAVNLSTALYRSKSLSLGVQPGATDEVILHLAMDPLGGSGARLPAAIALTFELNQKTREIVLNFQL